MPRDERPFFRVHAGVDEHPKVEPLSDKAFRLMIETWAWCRRNPQANGHLTAGQWAKRGTPKVRRELIDAGLFEDDLTGGVITHDYDDWQRTSDEIDAQKQQAQSDGLLGAHKRWHVDRRIRDPECPHCQSDSRPYSRASSHPNAHPNSESIG